MVFVKRRSSSLPSRRARRVAACVVLLGGALAACALLAPTWLFWRGAVEPRTTAGTPSAGLCPNPQKLGDDYGGWTICAPDGPEALRGGIVYTIGVGRNIEWDKAMISKFGTVHHGWDPTPSAIDFFEKKPPPAGFTHHRYGLGVADGEVTVKLPEGNKDSYTIMEYAAPAQNNTVVTIPVRTVESMLRMLGHTRLAVLKIDVEGIEFDVIAGWAKTGYSPPAKQILVEFHERYFSSKRTRGGVRPSTLVPTAVAHLRALGFDLMARQHWEYTFVRDESRV